MYVTPAMFEESSVGDYDERIYVLPGPVDIEENVRKAFSTRPISHRSKSFQVMMDNVKTVTSHDKKQNMYSLC